MKNDIKLDLTSEELKGILEEYYSKVLNKDVSLKIHTEKRIEEYWDDTNINIRMTFVAKERIGSREVDKLIQLNKKILKKL